jgi:DNA-binding MarR family transcriptional regulator
LDKTDLIKEIVELQRELNRDMREQTLKSLFFIANQGTTNFTKLAAALGVTPANVTGIIDRLVEHDLVSRQENPEDRRSLTLRVTEKGENTIASLRERRASRTTKILSNLSVEELNAIFRGFNLYIEAAKKVKQEPKKT